tara:strand:- start:1224 stop:1889 length:666 start_codon:yes stop_codon:yes gene_type:complete
MSQHLRHDLEDLEKALLSVGAQVEHAVRRAFTALQTRKADIAHEVMAGDEAIDRAEVKLEVDCLKVLALHHPVAGDLRFVAACLKINNDLERIGDLAVNVAKRAASLNDQGRAPLPPDLEDMTDTVAKMVRQSLDAFVKADAGLAREVMLTDDRVDTLNREVIDSTAKRMAKDLAFVEDGLLFISATKNLERIADHATNIAEDVVYMVEGYIIRHQGTPAT